MIGLLMMLAGGALYVAGAYKYSEDRKRSLKDFNLEGDLSWHKHQLEDLAKGKLPAEMERRIRELKGEDPPKPGAGA